MNFDRTWYLDEINSLIPREMQEKLKYFGYNSKAFNSTGGLTDINKARKFLYGTGGESEQSLIAAGDAAGSGPYQSSHRRTGKNGHLW